MVEATPPRDASSSEDTDPADERGLLEEAVRNGWAVLSSSRTFMVLAGFAALLVTAGAVVPQDAGRGELLERWDTAVVQTVLALDLNRVLTGWPFVLVLLLLALNAVGLYLKHRSLTAVEEQPARSWIGPGVARASGRLPASVDAVVGPAARALGVKYAASRKGHPVALRRGVWGEGLGLALFGLIVLGAAVLVGRTTGLDARISLVPGASDSASVRAEVPAGDTWIQRQLPFQVSCSPADPADPLRRRTCRVRGYLAEQSTEIGAGIGGVASGVRLDPRTERPIPGAGPPALLLRQGRGPEVLRAESGKTYELEDGTRVTPFTGPDGPLVVARPSEGRAVLLTPALEREAAALPSGLRVDGVPAWRVELAASVHPEKYLHWAGLGFLVLGLSMMGARPHLALVCIPRDGATEVRAWSFNRPGEPGRLLLELHALDISGEAEELA